MSRRYVIVVAALMLLVLAGCATPGPVVPQPPTVRVTQLDSLLFTPDVIKFRAKLVIDNGMNGGLNIQKIDYGADVNDKEIFTETFAQLHPMKAHGQQTVTFPFQIAMNDIENQAVRILAEGALRVSFRGEVYPAGELGFGPIPFRLTKTIPLPKIPSVSIEGTEGSPLRTFTVFLKIKNTNEFPLNIKSMTSYLELNGVKYNLLRTQASTEIEPGGTETVPLTMEQSSAKTLSMALNIAQSSLIQFNIGGEISCQTPYGLFYIPLKLHSETK